MTKRVAMASSPSSANDDIIIQILLFLPLQSLFISRSVCKFWRDLIDSPYFRKLHSNEHNHTVYLQFQYDHKRKLSINLLDTDTEKLLKSSLHENNDDFNNFRTLDIYSPSMIPCHLTKVAGPVIGLFCIYNKMILSLPIAVVNPFLRQIKILPISPILGSFHSESCHVDITARHVGISFGFGLDLEYKVVELLSCSKHRRLHAHLYSRRANSWRVLGGDGGLDHDFHIKKPVKSLSNNGYFAHWLAVRRMGVNNEEAEEEEDVIILTFDMKEEVFGFRKIEMPDYGAGGVKIFAKDDDKSFLLFVIPGKDSFSDTKLVKIYESRSCEGDYKLGWNVVMNDNAEPLYGIPLWRRGVVVLEHSSKKSMEAIFYDYFAKKFVGRIRIELPASCHRYRIIECNGSLISPLEM